MMERLPSGRDFVDNDGDVRPMADYYVGMDERDEALVDRIISGIGPIERTSEVPAGDTHYESTAAFAQGALFLFGKDMRPEATQSSIEQHPSAQNVEAGELSDLAQGIIAKYQDQIAQLEQYKARVDTSPAKRNAFIATIRNLQNLSQVDKEEIAQHLGHDKDFFNRDTEPAVDEQMRPRDWFERQYKD